MKPLSRLNFAMLVPTIAMFFLSTLDISYEILQNVVMFVNKRGTQIPKWLWCLKMLNFVLEMFLGDGILVRVWALIL